MNAVKITQTLKQALVDYLVTTFDANKDGNEPELARKIRESFEYPRALITGPYLEMIYPYVKGTSLNSLCQEGVLSAKLQSLHCFSLPKPEPIPLDVPLYLHQEKAIRKLCQEERSVVISSGTGSGKTECFTIPIVNDLLNDPTPGVRALLVYPMNALVNDQMERLRVILKGTSILFGRFTSELPDEEKRNSESLPNEIISRNEIRKEKKYPQILITNYAMLEYLLLRPEDSDLFDTGLWKYIVLDEAHTYTGAQGIEVAMLLRRLKQRLGKKPGEMLCIATSATLVNDNHTLAINFAKNLFSEDFSEEDIIFGDEERHNLLKTDQTQSVIAPENYLDPAFGEIIEEIRKIDPSNENKSKNSSPNIETIALKLNEMEIINNDGLRSAEKFQDYLPGFLYEVLSNNADLLKLHDWMIEADQPVLFEDAARMIFPSLDQQDQATALYRLIEICAIARPSPNILPLLPVKYHIFARPPQGIWACINPNCPGKDLKIETKWSRLYSNPTIFCESCGAQVYPIYLCRDCGQVYIATHFDTQRNIYSPAVEQLQEGNQKRYFTWAPIVENVLLSDTLEDDEESEDQEKMSDRLSFQQNQNFLCLNCGKLKTHCTCKKPAISIPLFDIEEKKTRTRCGKINERFVPIENLQECPRCHSKAKVTTEIVTPIKVHDTAPLANLTYELYRQLPCSDKIEQQKLPGEGRKLLTFCDSRQGAARFAAYLQDVSIKQNYRHIIPKAIEQFMKPDDLGESFLPNLSDLSRKSGEIALKNGIIFNDPDSDNYRSFSGPFSKEQRRSASIQMAKIILGEFTTGRRSRQSLESMGLAGISYFGKNAEPDFADIADKIGLSCEQVDALIGYLLDDLRFIKAVKLPDYVYPEDDSIFGPNRRNPHVIRQGKPNNNEVRWIGETSRQYRRQYIKRILEFNQINCSENNVINVLTLIWDWLINLPGLLSGSASDGYQIDPAYIYFYKPEQWFRCKRCQRLFYRGTSLPCPYPHCGGELEPIDLTSSLQHNYYFNLFRQELIPIRIEEHTAQIDSEKGKDYQEKFKKGNINALSCSTTFEMGIDLGDLQAVAMSNVPPTVANYRQRAGRAGRRTSGTAFILTWASDRPHDQAYYDHPVEIISGRVNVPNIRLENKYILRRHVNAILLSQFLRYRKNQGIETGNLTLTGSFFDNDFSDKPHYSFLQEWIQAASEEIKKSLQEFAEFFPAENGIWIKKGIDDFQEDLRKINDEHYQPITSYYKEQINHFSIQSGDTSKPFKETEESMKTLQYYQNLLSRMRGEKGRLSGFLIDYLSSRGVLPSYSFPLYTVELSLPKEIKANAHLRLERDLRQAIREYAPGSEIVADKRIWRSQRPLFWRETPKILEYRICEHCHHLDLSMGAGVSLPQTDIVCSVCHEPFGNKTHIRKFVEPDGFSADPKSGKPAGQYVEIKQNQMRSALIPEQNLEEEAFSPFINLSYQPDGKLLYVNEGEFGNGFSFAIQAFAFLSDSGEKEKFSLGHIQTTNTLHIRFTGNESIQIPSPDDQSFWLSLLYALIHGASHCLQIERRDIDGVLFPRSKEGSWEQTIVLYDNVPGGAGHVKAIKENFYGVLREARRILNCDDCSPDTSCYHCLRDYNNQFFHELLKREKALKFLDLLVAKLEPLEINIPGVVRIITSSPANWLLEKIRYAKKSVEIAIPKLTMFHPMGENYTWLDTLDDLLRKRCDVELFLQVLPEHSPEGYSLSRHLQVLMEKGLKVWSINRLPIWQIIIDKDTSEPRFISSEDQQNSIIFENQIGSKQLLSTTSIDAIPYVRNEWSQINREFVQVEKLNPPEHIKVINVPSNTCSGITEWSLFNEVFSKPCLKILVHDPYLFTKEHILNRLDAYINMAIQHNTLNEVIVHTKKVTDNEQTFAEQELNRKYHGLIQFKHTTEHDRYIDIIRVNGEKAKIIIGRGLDFIQPDGSTKSTFIVIQDPVV